MLTSYYVVVVRHYCYENVTFKFVVDVFIFTGLSYYRKGVHIPGRRSAFINTREVRLPLHPF